MATVNTFDDDSIRRIADTVRRLERQVRNLEHQVSMVIHSGLLTGPARAIRHGKTVQGSDDAYPTEGCKFWVLLQDWGFDPAAGTGDCDQTTTDWTDFRVLAKTYGGQWLPEDTPVIAVQVHGAFGLQWWIVPEVLEVYLGKLSGSLSQNGSATAAEWQRNSGDTGWEACSPTINHTVHDWLLGSGETISSGKKVVFADVRRDGKKVVIAAECE